MIIVLVGKFGLGRNFIILFMLIFGFLVKVIVVLIVLVKLCGGMFVVILIVIFELLEINKFGKCEGRIDGFFLVVL